MNKSKTLIGVLILVYGISVAYHQFLPRESLNAETTVTEITVTETTVTEPQVRYPTPGMAVQVVPTMSRIDYQPLDQFCLAKNIFHEAGIEDIYGKYAVAQVTLNRVANPRYPNSICEVVMQRSQFSWANDRSIRWTHPSGPLWRESQEVARLVLTEGHRLQGLEEANYYHADYVYPVWASSDYKIAQLGTHIFYSNTPRR